MELGLAEEVSWAGERARSNLSVGSAGELVRRMVVVVVVVVVCVCVCVCVCVWWW